MIIIILGIILSVAFLTLLERKLMGQLQRRIGPTKLGIYGIFQPLVDGIKLMLLKEIIFPQGINSIVFIGSSLLSLILSILTWLFIPITISHTFISEVFSGDILIYLMISEISIFTILFAGYSANNIWALFGSLRSTAQLISYSINMSLIIYCIILTISENSWTKIIDETPLIHNTIIHLPLIIIFIIIALSETNRAPFDLPEAESELVAGFFTEHSATLFVFFFLAEYINIYTISYITSLLFIGNTSLFLYPMLFIFIWVRASLPRLRFDQLIKFNWMYILVFMIGYVLIFSSLQLILSIS
jgi:NADH-ubiquinone oxidoreductase chain 1